MGKIQIVHSGLTENTKEEFNRLIVKGEQNEKVNNIRKGCGVFDDLGRNGC